MLSWQTSKCVLKTKYEFISFRLVFQGGELFTIGKSKPSTTDLGINMPHRNLLDAYQTIKGFIYREESL